MLVARRGVASRRSLSPHPIELHAKGLFPMDRLIEHHDIKDYARAIEVVKSSKVTRPMLKWTSIE